MPERAGISSEPIDRAPLSRRKSWGETLRISIKAIAPSTAVITAPDGFVTFVGFTCQ